MHILTTMFNRIQINILKSSPLWLHICVALILAMLLVGYATTRLGHEQRVQAIDDLLKAESIRTLEVFSAGALEAVISEDVGMLSTLIVETTQLEQNLFSVTIENSEGQSLVSWKRPQKSVPVNAYEFEREIAYEGDVFGTVFTVWDPTKHEARVNQQIVDERSRMLIALLSLTMLSLLLINFLVTVPLSKIENKLRNLSEAGDSPKSAIPLSLSSSRELALLSTAVNELQISMDESREMAIALEHQASHDYLTGLENRFAFEAKLRIHLAARTPESLNDFLLFLDLDQFKVVNDTCGHAAGDLLLQQLATVLKRTFYKNEIVARLGGDEFAVLIRSTSLKSGLELAEQLRSKIECFRFSWQDRLFSTSASIGVAAISGVGNRIEDIMSVADVACFAAKSAGRNRIHLYEQDDKELNARQSEMNWVPRIRSAIENSDFILFGQIIEPTSVTSKDSGHIEILIRLMDGDDLILPGAFLPAAERYDIISPIDRWVVTHTLEWMSAQFQQTGEFPKCAINISGASIGDLYFREFMLHTLEDSDVPGHCLCFEITETAAVANFDDAIAFMSVLKQFDCQFALDDFGSGMSSFTYLKNLPVDYVKIDGAFVRDLLVDDVSLAMVKALADVSAVMNIQTIAEFVETNDVRLKLEEIGIDYVQGYGVGKPQSLTQFEVSSVQVNRVA